MKTLSSPACGIRNKINKCQPVLGAHVFFTDPQITESLGYHGYEFVWIDAEHSAFDHSTILSHIMAASSAGTASIVRVRWNDPVIIKPVLEMGPDGLILPMVCSAKEAQEAVSACTYPPKGIRGFGPRRANRYDATPTLEYLEKAQENLLLIVQIEHIDAVADLENILTVPGIDLVMIGPNDMAGSIGRLGQLRDPQVLKLYDQAADICRRMGKPFGVSLGPSDRESIKDWVGRGAIMLACGDDLSFISKGSRETLAFLNECVTK